MIIDSRGIIQYVNPAFTQVTRYTFEEIVGKNAEELGVQSPEQRKGMWDTIKAGGEWQGEFQNKKKSGETYWEFAQISPVTNNDGVTTYFIKLAEDITALKEDGSWVLDTRCWSERSLPRETCLSFLFNWGVDPAQGGDAGSIDWGFWIADCGMSQISHMLA